MTERNELLHRVVEAYGGAARWSVIRQIALRVSANGLAFRMKWRAPMIRVPAQIDAHQPLVRFFPEKRDGLIEVFAGDEVRLERPDGSVVEARSNPQRFFPGGRRLLWWDRLDQIYFAGYARWNYVTFPALLTRDDIDWQASGDSTLRGRFPPGFPTHSQVQEFHVDPQTALLTQHDYTASVFGNWAKGAHRVLTHEEVDGIPFGTRRRVTPRRKNGTPAPFPLLVGIEFEAIGLD
ncbi:MAG: hypothetical protein OES69_06735 [Myxococcales bacterium]|nr:hypothetical protein [Myxococcales bacterium]